MHGPVMQARFTARTAAMMDDPDLTGDLLLVGLALTRGVDLLQVDALELPAYLAGCALWPDPDRAWQILRLDVRRYVADPGHRDFCYWCGQDWQKTGAILDGDTGGQTILRACLAHVEDLNTMVDANSAALAGRDVPRPYANTGGRLARHLPDLDWPAIYRCLSPRWAPYPEPEGSPFPAIPAPRAEEPPRLRLVH